MPGTATRAVECALPTPSLGQRASVIFRLLSDDQKVLTKNFPFVSVNGYPKMQTAMTLVHGVVFFVFLKCFSYTIKLSDNNVGPSHAVTGTKLSLQKEKYVLL